MEDSNKLISLFKTHAGTRNDFFENYETVWARVSKRFTSPATCWCNNGI